MGCGSSTNASVPATLASGPRPNGGSDGHSAAKGRRPSRRAPRPQNAGDNRHVPASKATPTPKTAASNATAVFSSETNAGVCIDVSTLSVAPVPGATPGAVPSSSRDRNVEQNVAAPGHVGLTAAGSGFLPLPALSHGDEQSGTNSGTEGSTMVNPLTSDAASGSPSALRGVLSFSSSGKTSERDFDDQDGNTAGKRPDEPKPNPHAPRLARLRPQRRISAVLSDGHTDVESQPPFTGRFDPVGMESYDAASHGDGDVASHDEGGGSSGPSPRHRRDDRMSECASVTSGAARPKRLKKRYVSMKAVVSDEESSDYFGSAARRQTTALSCFAPPSTPASPSSRVGRSSVPSPGWTPRGVASAPGLCLMPSDWRSPQGPPRSTAGSVVSGGGDDTASNHRLTPLGQWHSPPQTPRSETHHADFDVERTSRLSWNGRAAAVVPIRQLEHEIDAERGSRSSANPSHTAIPAALSSITSIPELHNAHSATKGRAAVVPFPCLGPAPSHPPSPREASASPRPGPHGPHASSNMSSVNGTSTVVASVSASGVSSASVVAASGTDDGSPMVMHPATPSAPILTPSPPSTENSRKVPLHVRSSNQQSQSSSMLPPLQPLTLTSHASAAPAPLTPWGVAGSSGLRPPLAPTRSPVGAEPTSARTAGSASRSGSKRQSSEDFATSCFSPRTPTGNGSDRQRSSQSGGSSTGPPTAPATAPAPPRGTVQVHHASSGSADVMKTEDVMPHSQTQLQRLSDVSSDPPPDQSASGWAPPVGDLTLPPPAGPRAAVISSEQVRGSRLGGSAFGSPHHHRGHQQGSTHSVHAGQEIAPNQKGSTNPFAGVSVPEFTR